MRAFLLAAGLGTRLRPLTDHTPKCLLPINGQPLLAIWLDLLARHGVDEVLINTHHLSDQVEGFLSSVQTHLRVRTAFEPKLLGSAGTLRAQQDFVAGEDVFLVCYADNLTDADLSSLVSAHQSSRPPLTMGLFRAANPSGSGIVDLDADGLVLGFQEKPEAPRSDLANAGIYVASQEIFALLEDRIPLDVGFDLLPKLVGRMRGVLLETYLRDIGTPESYANAQEEWRRDH